MESTSYLNLDLQRPDISAVSCAVADDSNSRLIRARLSDGGLAWTPPSGTLGQIRFMKPDGHGGAYDALPNGSEAVTFDGSTAVLALADQVLALDGPGTVRMQLHLYNTAGERLSSFAFDLFVGENVLTDATIESTDYYNLLTTQISAVLNAAESLTGMTASAQSVAHDYAGRLVDITGGSGGVPYNLDFKIPAGPQGIQGPQGPKGLDGQGTVNSVMGVSPDANLDVPSSELLPIILDAIYPVGSIYMSVNNVSPATFIGGTWVAIENCFLIGAGRNHTAGETGGAETVALTADNNGPHTHEVIVSPRNSSYPYAGVYQATQSWSGSASVGTIVNSSSNKGRYIADTSGSGTPFSILPPYLAVYIWKRTA